jgi:hypothetical protein
VKTYRLLPSLGLVTLCLMLVFAASASEAPTPAPSPTAAPSLVSLREARVIIDGAVAVGVAGLPQGVDEKAAEAGIAALAKVP